MFEEKIAELSPTLQLVWSNSICRFCAKFWLSSGCLALNGKLAIFLIWQWLTDGKSLNWQKENEWKWSETNEIKCGFFWKNIIAPRTCIRSKKLEVENSISISYWHLHLNFSILLIVVRLVFDFRLNSTKEKKKNKKQKTKTKTRGNNEFCAQRNPSCRACESPAAARPRSTTCREAVISAFRPATATSSIASSTACAAGCISVRKRGTVGH